MNCFENTLFPVVFVYKRFSLVFVFFHFYYYMLSHRFIYLDYFCVYRTENFSVILTNSVSHYCFDNFLFYNSPGIPLETSSNKSYIFSFSLIRTLIFHISYFCFSELHSSLLLQIYYITDQTDTSSA